MQTTFAIDVRLRVQFDDTNPVAEDHHDFL